jgi:hypothetical protein
MSYRSFGSIRNSFIRNDWKRVFTFSCAVLFLSSALQAEENCPVEVKLLLSAPALKTVIASLRFENETAGRVYFYDTEELSLSRQGVILRARQGASNDLTVKVRVPQGNKQIDTSGLRKHFPCEIDKTGAGENTSYSVRRKYKALRVPESGSDIFRLLGPLQQRLLREARVSIDWARVERIADIKLTKWESTAQPPFRKLALELWDFPAGHILELSTKAGPGEGKSNYAELQRLVSMKGLALSANQGSKTSMVLETLTRQEPTPR